MRPVVVAQLKKACVGRRVTYFSMYQSSTSDCVQVPKLVLRSASQARKSIARLILCRESFVVEGRTV
jgi:hypothetical protein